MNLSDLWNKLAQHFAFGQDALKQAAGGQPTPSGAAPTLPPANNNGNPIGNAISKALGGGSVEDQNNTKTGDAVKDYMHKNWKALGLKSDPTAEPTHKQKTDQHSEVLDQHSQALQQLAQNQQGLMGMFQKLVTPGGMSQQQQPQPPRPMQMNAPGIGIGGQPVG